MRVSLYLKHTATTHKVSSKGLKIGFLEFCKKQPLGSVYRRTTVYKLLVNRRGADASVDKDLDIFVGSCFL